VIRTSRLVLALALTLALGVSGIALAGGGAAAENVSEVTGQVSGKAKPKFDKKKFKKTSLFTQVQTDYGTPTGDPTVHSEQVFIDFGKNLKIKTGVVPKCTANTSLMTTDEARAACSSSRIGQGQAKAHLPSPGGTVNFNDFEVTVFNGPDDNQLILHAFSPTLTGGVVGPGNPANIVGDIVKSPAGKKYGKRLAVNDVSDVQSDLGGLYFFNATIKKGKYIQARCKAKKMLWRATWVYDDGTSDTDTFSQKCKRKKKK
jgi:hypothetical protein